MREQGDKARGARHGHRILVIGASRGIGRAIALACARDGAQVIMAGRDITALEQAAHEITELTTLQGAPTPLAYACDVSDPSQVSGLYARLSAPQGSSGGPRLDGMVCAAGILGPLGPIDELDPHELKRTIDTNLVGSALAVAGAARLMKPRRSGRIVLFSGAGEGPKPGWSAYAASKGGIWRLTESLGAELAPHGILLNAIAPGAVNTRFLDEMLAAGPERAGADEHAAGLKRRQQGGVPPERAAELARWLLFDPALRLFGRTLSAVWDDYRSLTPERQEEASRSALFAYRRIVPPAGRDA